MTVTRDAVEAFLTETITDPNGIPTTTLHALAEERGITPQDIRQHGRRLRLTTASCAQQMTGLQRGPCIACGESTSYADPDHRLACCPDCTSPITTWRWERPEPGRARRKEKVKAGRRDTGWPANEGLARQATCNSVMDRARAKVPFCTETVVWKVEVVRGSTIYRSYWCDADLPVADRPDAPAPALSSGGGGSGEQHGLF
ncbi:hypothetical protein [Streptomyces sediminimaris]|uniref:hypothetical protein n=1 Tax=Streptomyces sediminimaris TaxID=3383721 RepID=UPI00399B673F